MAKAVRGMRITESAARRQNACETLHGILAIAKQASPTHPNNVFVPFDISVQYAFSVAAPFAFVLFVRFVFV